MLARTSKLALLIFLSYLGVAIVQTWPLTLHLSTQLPGPPGGDTGVYVWNTWVFRHELVDLGRSPFSTAMMAYDSTAGKFVLFGGYNTSDIGGTWEY